ncbi:MAG: S8 family serine peptidase [Chloroflexi bacterium]|nr:S8 family serine peptidase [Chloroflexota bacterium]
MLRTCFRLAGLAVLLATIAPVSVSGAAAPAGAAHAPQAKQTVESASAPVTGAKTSNRLIVELKSPPAATLAASATKAPTTGGHLNLESPQVQTYIAQIKTEQASFVRAMQVTLPTASVARYINELGQSIPAAYQIVFNGVAVDPGNTRTAEAMRTLSRLPGVKAVYPDSAHDPSMYASLPLIDAQAAWDNTAIGGQANAGRGVKVASMDGGIHHDAPMFSGAGFSYPPGWPSTGKGLTANNNGKIILSRVYFRPWDPPSPGDENPWPGTQGTSHGTHTASTAAGDPVTATYRGVTVTLSGVAPAAWVMSYRVFYNSVTNNGSFYNVEGLAALEDIARDGADVLNNSWGSSAGSVGGQFDPLDQALINVSRAGTFVSMATGNDGPDLDTSDHASPDYINVAASTTTGTYASGRLSVSAPAPLTTTLQNMPFSTANFGASAPPGQVISYSFVAGEVVSPANVLGCSPWDPGTFTGKAALIRRGTCDFSLKTYYAQQAGASFVVIYNQAANGNNLIGMAAGMSATLVTIQPVLVGNTNGVGMVNWYNANGAASELTFDTTAFQIGNVPDVIASFSSRGPGVGNVLKPDIAAPGVNILAQGFGDGAGEARHLGFGQVSGTSMAAPHVAGAAALLRQIHPNWSNAYIKSALMSTSKYTGIFVDMAQTIPAQPLDMGAGRLDLTHAADPGVILDPPSLSFGLAPTGTSRTVSFNVTNITTGTEVYQLGTLYTGAGYSNTTDLPGFSLSANVITLTAGASAQVSAVFSSSLGMGLGDNQGFVVMTGAVHNAHMPVWARVTYQPAADILIIKNDGASSLGFNDYLSYYTAALTDLGYTWNVLDVDALAGYAATFLNTIDLLNYKAIIYYTGDYYLQNGTFSVPTPLTASDMDSLQAYANNGGTVIAMGQDVAWVLGATGADSRPNFYANVLGGLFWRDSVSGNGATVLPIGPTSGAPSAFQSLHLDLGVPSAYAVAATLDGGQEAPPNASTMTGQANGAFDVATRLLNYTIVITGAAPYTLTAAHIHSGAIGVSGPVLYTLLNTLTPVATNQYTLTGNLVVNAGDVSRLLSGGDYINVHTDVYPGGEIRGQLSFLPNKDGAANQYYVDEIGIDPSLPDQRDPTDPLNPLGLRYKPILKYPGSGAMEDNVVAMAHRDQPMLETPGISYLGRSVYAAFGLEGVNDTPGYTDRATLLQRFLNFAWDQPGASVVRTTTPNGSHIEQFTAAFTSTIGDATPVSYRWDYGDGTPYVNGGGSPLTSHSYQLCGPYTVRVEVTDSYGNHSIGVQPVVVTQCQLYIQRFIIVMKNGG